MEGIKEFIKKHKVIKLLKYISVSTVIIYFLFSVIEVTSKAIFFNQMISNNQELEENLQMIQEGVRSAKEDADDQLQKDDGLKNDYIKMRSKYPESVVVMRNIISQWNEQAVLIVFSIVSGIFAGILIYLYKNLDSFSKYIVGVVVILAILVIIFALNIQVHIFPFNNDLMSIGYTTPIVGSFALGFTIATIIIITAIKILMNIFDKKKMNKLIK